MWSRVELKSRAKDVISRNYWWSVLAALVLLIAVGGGNIVTILKNIQDALDRGPGYYIGDYGYQYYDYYSSPEISAGMGIFLGILAMVMGVMWLLYALLGIFVFLPIEIGGCRFFLENSYEPVKAGKLFFAFKNGRYWKAVGTMFLRDLFVGLWSLLFVIPGIYKSYEYRMVPYLLADCPELSRQDAFRISKEMMDGQKMDAFILDLSFLGWDILCGLTFGILEIFYVGPYRHATNAELFLELKRDYFAKRGQYEM